MTKKVYITTEEELDQLLLMDQMIKEINNKLESNTYFDITYSKDFKTNQILNIKMVFNTHNDKIINSIFNNIDIGEFVDLLLIYLFETSILPSIDLNRIVKSLNEYKKKKNFLIYIKI